MTPEIKSMALLAAKVGHRTPAGHHAVSVGSLLGIEPEHPNHGDRQLWLLAEQTEGLARALSSHDRGAEPRAGDQRTMEGC